MEYTKKAMAIIKEDIDYAYGSWIEGNQLSEKDYAEEQERLAIGILEDLGAAAMHKALKKIASCDSVVAGDVIDIAQQVLAEADKK